MVRVYFNLAREGEMLLDGEGIDIAEVDRTISQVLRTLKEQQLSDPARQASWEGWTVHITDENGIELATIPLSTKDQ
jgi:hypothetical protein